MRYLTGLYLILFSIASYGGVEVPTQTDFDSLDAKVADLDARLSALEDGTPTEPPVDPPIDPPVDPPVTPPDALTCADIDGPCVVFDGSNTWKEAMQSVPLTGGTLLVQPGKYLVASPPWLSGRDSLTIIGVRDENGLLPHLWSELKTLNSFVPWGGTNKNLTIKNIKFDTGGNCIYSGSKTNQQTITLENVELVNCGHGLMGAYEYEKGSYAGTTDDSYLLRNVTCTLSGTHCIYIDRAAYAEIDGGVYHSPGYHAIKVVTRELWIHDVTVSNLGLNGELRPDGKIGAAPMSLVACQRGVVEDNDIRFFYNAGTGGGIIQRQPRHDIKGCDIPPYTSDEFWSEGYWQLPDTFPMSIKNNTITIEGDRGSGIVLNVVVSTSTAPVESIATGSTRLKFLPRPEWWIERSRTIMGDNAITGLQPQDNECISTFWGQMVDGDVPPPPFTEMCITGATR